ncbi:hypothetical protein E2C01_033947 [Portunus trituberculatus]|uniref:Secreted protein n=1 Tax=Portunus trituberculatus TaxID=210409 RepID=A0A5B7F074_PORTR|nr:hypothetical protein [Portunus trituberculatus]
MSDSWAACSLPPLLLLSSSLPPPSRASSHPSEYCSLTLVASGAGPDLLGLTRPHITVSGRPTPPNRLAASFTRASIH